MRETSYRVANEREERAWHASRLANESEGRTWLAYPSANSKHQIGREREDLNSPPNVNRVGNDLVLRIRESSTLYFPALF